MLDDRQWRLSRLISWWLILNHLVNEMVHKLVFMSVRWWRWISWLLVNKAHEGSIQLVNVGWEAGESWWMSWIMMLVGSALLGSWLQPWIPPAGVGPTSGIMEHEGQGTTCVHGTRYSSASPLSQRIPWKRFWIHFCYYMFYITLF